MTDCRISTTTATYVFVTALGALIAQSILQSNLRSTGLSVEFARDLSFFIVPIVMGLMFIPLWRTDKGFWAQLLRRSDLNWQLAFQAIAIGLLLRLVWWGMLISAVSFGLIRSENPQAIIGPALSFQCPTFVVAAVGFLVMAILIPFIEEIVHRAYIVSALRHRGFAISIIGSALVFALLHRSASVPFAFVAGIVFGMQYWFTRSLWASLLSHATFNGLIQLDWRCLSVHWNPMISEVPFWTPGVVSILAVVVSAILIARILRKMATGVTSSTPVAKH